VSYAGVLNCFLLLCAAALYSFSNTFPQYWLKWWTEDAKDRSWFYMLGYLLLAFIAWAATSYQAWITQIGIAARSGKRLHQLLLSIIVNAPLNFYSATDIGVIVNRFSQDIELVDKDLPNAAQSLIAQVCKLLVQLCLLLAVQRLLLLSLPICFGIVYLTQLVYLRTSRQLRLLDIELRSAVVTSFLETIEGITTLRAFGWQKKMEARMIQNLDISQKATFILSCVQRWLNLVLNLMVMVIATSIIALGIWFRSSHEASGASIGVAMNVIIVTNTTLISLVESWTKLEISLGAIARLKHMKETTPSEIQAGEVIPELQWPSEGVIELDGVTASYK
jgi:ATP-binding cassette subfamily C (CFTR/MRP) protein 1